MGTKVSLFEETSTFVIEPWNVILINDNRHTFDEVIVQFTQAMGRLTNENKGLEQKWEGFVKQRALLEDSLRRMETKMLEDDRLVEETVQHSIFADMTIGLDL